MSYALEFEEKQAIRFGDIIAFPKVDNELQLRLSTLTYSTVEDIEHAIDVLSKAFGDQSGKIRGFMADNMTADDLAKLQVYLTRGVAGLKTLEKAEDKLLDSQIANVAGGRG